MEQPERPTPSPITATKVRCSHCGYDLTGVSIGANCPECGEPVNASYIAAGMKTSGYAVACLVLGIVASLSSTFGCLCMGTGPFVGLPCGIVGLFMYRAANREIRAGLAHPGSSPINVAGLVCSIVGVVMGTIFLGLIAASIIQDFIR